MKKVVDRFLKYVRVNSQSDENSISCPSTSGQMELAKLIASDMNDIGFEEISLDDNGYLMGTIPSNSNKNIPVIGFIAHLDTSPDMSGSNVMPEIIENYDGRELILNPEKKVILTPLDFPELLNYKGQTIITTDGTTLLGADDKAGIAEIMTSMEFIMRHPEIKHGKIRVAFTPDEEIGRGADKFDVKKFGAQFAYTVDGGQIGELEFENFNAAMAIITIQGRNVHPGTAKKQMINSIHIATELNGMLPNTQRPEHTEGYEGFFHFFDFTGTVEETKVRFLIRDHDTKLFELKKKMIVEAVEYLNLKYGEGRIVMEVKDQYFNMKKMIEPIYFIVEYADKAMMQCGVTPIIKPVRGGTDGARLSFMGLPCPNLFSGGHNYHGKFEFIPVESMHKAVEVITGIVRIVAETAVN
jgi:tripeptide aminopeptidase